MVYVDGWFYIANSTFEWYPGVEIHRSKDLAHWELCPSPLNKASLLDMQGNPSSCGIWAPCLTHSDGLFYLIYTNVRSWNSGPWKDTPNFLTTAPNIEGPWSAPVFLNASGFDPSLFHDDDGRKYVVNMEWDYRKASDKDKFTGILLQEYSAEHKKLIGPIQRIFTGTSIKLVEGPHLYKRDGYYYLLCAEGGTQYEHAATVARSENIGGPYEVHPSNPLISSYGHPEIRLQKAGHTSWCDAGNGKSYLAFLCGRPLAGTKNCPLGRETGIAEIAWKDGWPYVKYAAGTEKGIGFGRTNPNYPPDEFESPVPLSGELQPYSVEKKYIFDGISIDSDFKTLRIPLNPEIYSLTARPGFLRLRGGYSPVSRFNQTLLARRQQDFSFQAETYIESEPKSFQELAGLIWRYDEDNQYLLSISYDEQKGRVLSVQTMIGRQFARTEDMPLPASGGIYLGLTVIDRRGFFRWSLDGALWNTLRPELDAAVLSDEYFVEAFTGAFVGMFCVDTASYSSVADFKYFLYKPGAIKD
jgi:xylan 1,4-beta-xylosidase